MKVLVLHSELGVLQGGGENVTRELFGAFARRGHRVRAAFVADRRGRYPLALPDGFEPHPLAGWWSATVGQRSLSRWRHRLPAGGRLEAALDRVQEALSWRSFAWHKRRFRERIAREFVGRWDDYHAIYVHGDVILASQVASRRPTVLRLPGPVGADSIPFLQQVQVVCSNGDALVRTRDLVGDHVVELPVGLDAELFSPGTSSIRTRLGWGPDDCVLGYVGRLTHLKGVDILASAFRELAGALPEVRLLMVGCGEAEGRLRGQLAPVAAGRVQLESSVPHHELPDWFRAMDVMVMPSRYENYSNALLEAMGCGLPFVASDVGGNRTLAAAGAGWLFESGSPAALRTRLSEVIARPGERRERGALAARMVRDHYSWAASAERLEAIIGDRLGVAA
jgi:glycosyltransferase involved in cell wall biosynthesis